MLEVSPQTHLKIKNALCGTPIELNQDRCKVKLSMTSEMQVDEHGLIHGGFIFGLADYAAMLVVNHPNVVLASASVRFIKPASVGDDLTAEASVLNSDHKKIKVEVQVWNGVDECFYGEFLCIIPETHVLS